MTVRKDMCFPQLDVSMAQGKWSCGVILGWLQIGRQYQGFRGVFGRESVKSGPGQEEEGGRKIGFEQGDFQARTRGPCRDSNEAGGGGKSKDQGKTGVESWAGQLAVRSRRQKGGGIAEVEEKGWGNYQHRENNSSGEKGREKNLKNLQAHIFNNRATKPATRHQRTKGCGKLTSFSTQVEVRVRQPTLLPVSGIKRRGAGKIRGL